MNIPTAPFVTDCLVIVLRVKLRAKLLYELTSDAVFDIHASNVSEGVYKSREAFLDNFEADLREMPLTLKYFKRLRHHEHHIPMGVDKDTIQLIEEINQQDLSCLAWRPSDRDLVRFPQRSAEFINSIINGTSSSCNS